jgi:hypothetical protein
MTRQSFRPEVERLETRAVPAGNVLVNVSASGAMSIVGDNASNSIRITQAEPGSGIFTVSGEDGTLVNGGGSYTNLRSVTRGVSINMRGGDDTVIIGAEPPSETALEFHNVVTPGDLEIRTGDGDDTVRIEYAHVMDDLEIDTGSGIDHVVVEYSTVDGDADVRTDGGADTVYLEWLSVAGDLDVRTGSDGDQVDIEYSDVGGNTRIRTDGGADSVSVYGSYFNQDVRVRTGDDGDFVYFTTGEGAPRTTIDGDLHIDTDGGSDEVELYAVRVAGDATIRTGSGDDRVYVTTGIVAPDSDIGGSLVIRTGRGDDFVRVEDTTVGGDTFISLGRGDDTLEVANSTFNGAFRARGRSNTTLEPGDVFVDCNNSYLGLYSVTGFEFIDECDDEEVG